MKPARRNLGPVELLHKKTEIALFTQFVSAQTKRDAIAQTTNLSPKEAVEHFADRLIPCRIDRPDDPALKEAYTVYLENFPIKEEQESLSGFKEVLGYNQEAQLAQEYGAFKEEWICLRDPATQKIIAGINFSTYDMAGIKEAAKHVDGTQHLTYLFVSPEHRSMGIAKKLISLADEASRQFLCDVNDNVGAPSSARMVSFNEQNQPLKMSLYNYFFDTQNSLIDQCDRLGWWDKRGYKALDFQYIQPPLEQGGEACYDLALNAKSDMPSVPATVIKAHLNKFFSLSVLKNVPAMQDQHFRQVASDLDIKRDVRHAPVPDFGRLKQKVWKLIGEKTRATLGSIKEATIGQMFQENPEPKATSPSSKSQKTAPVLVG